MSRPGDTRARSELDLLAEPFHMPAPHTSLYGAFGVKADSARVAHRVLGMRGGKACVSSFG
jgi:hypothetical protein